MMIRVITAKGSWAGCVSKFACDRVVDRVKLPNTPLWNYHHHQPTFASTKR